MPVFLLSGQSNMTGYSALVSDLTADQKKNVDSVMIYMDADGDAAKKKKRLTLGPGFGAGSSNLGPELSFGRTLSDSMPGKKIAFIKDAVGGTFLDNANGWLPPSGGSPCIIITARQYRLPIKIAGSSKAISGITVIYADHFRHVGKNNRHA